MTEQLHLKIVNQKQTIEEELTSAISENILLKKLCLESNKYIDYEKK